MTKPAPKQIQVPVPPVQKLETTSNAVFTAAQVFQILAWYCDFCGIQVTDINAIRSDTYNGTLRTITVPCRETYEIPTVIGTPIKTVEEETKLPDIDIS